MKFRASTKIAISAVLLGAGVYGGSKAYTVFRLNGVEIKPVEPTDFCLVAIGKSAPVRVITANHMAQIVETSGSLENQGSSEGGAEGGAIKRRIPVKEMLGILEGDVESVAPMLQKLRAKDDESEITDDTPVWEYSDVEKALNGDPALSKKLQTDLSTSLDGKPFETLNLSAFYNGIAVKIPVELNIQNAKGSSISGFDIVGFKPRYLVKFYKEMQQKFYDKSSLQMFYKQFLMSPDNANGTPLKTAFASLKSSSLTSPEKQSAEKIVGVSTILLNKSMITSGEMMEDKSGKTVTYDIKLKMNQEGRNRLWKFSAEGGEKLLVISKGVPIASATIGTVLNGEELVIKQITERKLVVEAVESLQNKG